MKNIIQKYYRYQKGNDLKNLHFTDKAINIDKDEESSLSNNYFIVEENFILYLRDLDINKFLTTLEKIVKEAKEKYFLIDYSSQVEKLEDGYNIYLKFVTRR